MDCIIIVVLMVTNDVGCRRCSRVYIKSGWIEIYVQCAAFSRPSSQYICEVLIQKAKDAPGDFLVGS